MFEVTKYFGDCHEKYIMRFNETTPDGNHIQGYICTKSNMYYGSLLITIVNGESTNQFVQSFPKIDYYSHESDISVCNEKGSWRSCFAYEKMDGSCLITYPLLDSYGFLIEIVPKTRGRAVADKHFLDLYNKCDKSSIYEYYKNNKGILYFELHGILNQHEILHYNIGIDLVLIGVNENNIFGDALTVDYISSVYNFKQPDTLFVINPNGLVVTTKKYQYYLNDIQSDELNNLSVSESINKIQSILDYLNKSYYDINKRIATEGVVLNCIDANNMQRYIKIKPTIIKMKHNNKIPNADIRKECLKYFDEYGSQVKEIYESDKNHHTEYIYRMLSEDYPIEYIKKSAKRIEKIFMQIWESKQVPESIHSICEDLFDNHADKGITECMRIFGTEYPMKKRESRTVYRVLKIKFKQRGVPV